MQIGETAPEQIIRIGIGGGIDPGDPGEQPRGGQAEFSGVGQIGGRVGVKIAQGNEFRALFRFFLADPAERHQRDDSEPERATVAVRIVLGLGQQGGIDVFLSALVHEGEDGNAFAAVCRYSEHCAHRAGIIEPGGVGTAAREDSGGSQNQDQ